VMQKPFDPKKLARRVRELLDLSMAHSENSGTAQRK